MTLSFECFISPDSQIIPLGQHETTFKAKLCQPEKKKKHVQKKKKKKTNESVIDLPSFLLTVLVTRETRHM